MFCDLEDEVDSLIDAASASAIDAGCDGCQYQGVCHQSRDFGCQSKERRFLDAQDSVETPVVAELSRCLELASGLSDGEFSVRTSGQRLAALLPILSDLRCRAEQLGV